MVLQSKYYCTLGKHRNISKRKKMAQSGQF